MRYRHLACVLLALLPAACGKKGPSTVPVSGRITLNNRPLANAVVTFSLADGKPSDESSARTDAQGNYSLRLKVNHRDGAVPGRHRVRISLFDRGDARTPARGQQLPPGYNHN